MSRNRERRQRYVSSLSAKRHTDMTRAQKPAEPPKQSEIKDEPGMAERFERGLQRALNSPPQRRGKPSPEHRSTGAQKRKEG